MMYKVKEKTTKQEQYIFGGWSRKKTLPIFILYVLKSVHFKKTVAKIFVSFKIAVLFVLICIESMYHNFERNEIRATVFLQWTDFNSFIFIF